MQFVHLLHNWLIWEEEGDQPVYYIKRDDSSLEEGGDQPVFLIYIKKKIS